MSIHIGAQKIRSDGDNEITFAGLSNKEKDKIIGFMAGVNRLEIKEGKLISHNVNQPIPDPEYDHEVAPFWATSDLQLELFNYESTKNNFPGIIIRHLNPGNKDSKDCKVNAEILKSFGFIHHRSMRDGRGFYSDLWFLPGFFSAKGNLKHHIDELKKDCHGIELHKGVVNFLCKSVRFGTLDLVCQRAAYVVS